MTDGSRFTVTAGFTRRCLAHRAEVAAGEQGRSFEIVRGTTYVIDGKEHTPGEAADLLGIPVMG